MESSPIITTAAPCPDYSGQSIDDLTALLGKNVAARNQQGATGIWRHIQAGLADKSLVASDACNAFVASGAGIQFIDDVNTLKEFYSGYASAIAGGDKWVEDTKNPKKAKFPLRIFSKPDERFKQKTVLSVAELDVPWEQMFVHQFDENLYKKIDDSVKSVKTLKEVNATDGFYQSEMKFPWPMANRESVSKTHYSIDVQNKAYIELSKSIKAGEKYHDVVAPPATKKPVRMDIHFSVRLVQKVSDKKIRVVTMNNMDIYVTSMSAAKIDLEQLADIPTELETFVKVIGKAGPKELVKYKGTIDFIKDGWDGKADQLAMPANKPVQPKQQSESQEQMKNKRKDQILKDRKNEPSDLTAESSNVSISSNITVTQGIQNVNSSLNKQNYQQYFQNDQVFTESI